MKFTVAEWGVGTSRVKALRLGEEERMNAMSRGPKEMLFVFKRWIDSLIVNGQGMPDIP